MTEVTSQQGNGGKKVSKGKIVGTICQGSHDFDFIIQSLDQAVDKKSCNQTD